jgi:hypothetical protein
MLGGKQLEQLSLTLGQLRRHVDRDQDSLVAPPDPPASRNALATHAQGRPGLRPRGHSNPGPSVERRHVDFATERCVREGNGHRAHHVVSIALEDGVGPDSNRDLEIAGGPVGPRPAAGPADSLRRAFLDARGNRNSHRVIGRGQAQPAARRATVLRDSPCSPTPRARALYRDGEDALLHARSSSPSARRTDLRRGPRPSSGAVAFNACDDPRIPDSLFATGHRFLEGHLEKMLEVTFVAAADPEDPQQISENAANGDIADVDPASRKGTTGSKRRARFFGAMSETVIH